MRAEIISEIGQNHNGDMKLAKDLIRASKDCGADVAKFQLYDSRALFPKENNPWYDYNCTTELSRARIDELANECAKLGIEFMASVFDVERVDWLEAVGVKRYKIASRSVRETALIERLVATGKPLIVSLGMWGEKEFPVIKSKAPVDFLYCISKYPTPFSDLKLSEVDFKKHAGFSDHSIGISGSLAAISLGARIIEKHFTLDKTLYGPDHSGSMTPDELKALSAYAAEISEAL
ncbi:N-acetylneuraminate synthase family protein [Rhodoferax saidenbachensis]|nr:N-acetylneuraminate synthase family protein [Rhodoferax saidenbachensis]